MTRHLVVIGAQRSGTTYLADLLAAHHDVALASPRTPEPKVFLDEGVVERGARWYDDTWFADRGPASLLVEKSTSYLDHPSAAARIDRLLDRPLVLAQLRDPVARAVSHWRFSTGHDVEHRPLVDALTESLDEELPWDPSRFSVSPFAYVSRGDYAHALRPWAERFGDRLRVQFLEELTTLDSELDGLAAWLDLDHLPRPPDEPVNDSPGEEPVLPADLVARLRDRYRPGDRSLRELLGRPLPWDRPTVTDQDRTT